MVVANVVLWANPGAVLKGKLWVVKVAVLRALLTVFGLLSLPPVV